MNRRLTARRLAARRRKKDGTFLWLCLWASEGSEGGGQGSLQPVIGSEVPTAGAANALASTAPSHSRAVTGGAARQENASRNSRAQIDSPLRLRGEPSGQAKALAPLADNPDPTQAGGCGEGSPIYKEECCDCPEMGLDRQPAATRGTLQPVQPDAVTSR